MASYNPGTNPPSRQGDVGRGRRMAVSLQQGLGTTTHISGPVDPKRRVATPVQTIASRPSIKDPPTLRPRPEAQNTIASTFGFGISGSRPSLTHSSRSSRNVLRRKQSSIAQLAVTSSPASELVMPNTIIFGIPHIMERQKTSIDSSVRSAEAYHDIFARSDSRASNAIKSHRPVIPELNRWGSYSEQATASSRIMTLPHKLSTKDLPPAVPSTITTPVYSGGSSHHRYSGFSGSGYSASPSTRFSESPGPSSYSRDTTPTSMSSQSPGIYIPLKITTPRLRQGSAPTSNKPPVSSVTRRAGSTTEPDVTASPVASSGLSIVRESLTSSSSNSTVKGDEKGKGREREKKKKKRLSPLPPSPPPRKSSQRFQKINQGEHDTTSKTSQSPAKPLMMSSPTRLDSPSDNSRVVKPSITGTQPKISYAKAQRLEAKVHESKVMPPTRPSREGAQLPAHFVEPLNVIQSNLTNFSIPPNRRRSAVPSPLQIQTSFRPQGSRVMSRNPSPASFTPSREATPAPSKLGIVPDLKPRQIPSSSRGTTPSPSSDSRSRFGLFSRRTKTELAIGIKDKVPRKGPAAGTGHEGYGRYGLRGRSSSAGGQGRHERSYSVASSSQESIASTIAMHDPFLLQRMSPVIIAGGGVIKENCNPAPELYRTESGSSLVLDGSSMNSRRPSKSNPSHEVSRTTLWPSASSKETSRRTSAVAPPKSRRRPSDSSDDGYRQNTLALRRSIQRLGNSAATLDLPRPLNIPSVGDSPSLTSLDASVMSDDSRFESEAETRGRKNQLAKPKKLEKRPKSPTKWNLFQRSKPVVKTATPALAVIIGRAVPKLLPHYALMDSSDDQKEADAMVLEDLLRENDVVSLSNEELDELQFGHDQENMRRIENLRMNVPSPVFSLPPLFSSPEPIIIPELAKKELHLVKETAPIRPSRLPQVGRIPKVISARPETTSPRSFSRPFARLSIAHPRELLVADKQSLGLGPSPPKPSAPEPVANITVHRVSADSKSESTASHHDFLAFSPRQNSAATTSSSGGLSFIDTTAMIPAKDAELEMDEVWDEYDDLIENDDTIQVPASATSSYGIPFQYESFESRQIRKSRQRAKESPTFPIPKATEPGPERISHLTSSSVYSQEMSTRLKEALSTLPSPTTPLSFTDFFSGYGDRNNSFMSTTSPPRHSSQIDARRSTSGSENSRTLSELLAMDEQENPSPQSQVNLRVGSMTVSKWLTFGHVLFSPAKEEIIHIDQEPMRSHSILVIDGLGNDDWSFYAAETYRNATFYNLSPSASMSTSQHNSGLPSTPPNHRQIQYLSPLSKFPFPSSFFSIVVLRFPAAISEAAYKTLISESKRILKPGGYLEITILDLDMLNMGNRARRAVRSLKERLRERNGNVWTGSASDTILRLLGHRGFADVKSCNVGVPVAGAVSSPSVSSSTDKGKGKAAETTTMMKEKAKTRVEKRDLSLADLLKTDSPSASTDIANTVARVGRWWYTRCYESAAGEKSIWHADEGRRLLRECEKRGASFKLVVAYAQKPALGAGIGSLGRRDKKESPRKRGLSV